MKECVNQEKYNYDDFLLEKKKKKSQKRKGKGKWEIWEICAGEFANLYTHIYSSIIF